MANKGLASRANARGLYAARSGSLPFAQPNQLVRNSPALDLRFLLDCGEETDRVGFYVDGLLSRAQERTWAKTL